MPASKTAKVSLLFPLPTISSDKNFFKLLVSFCSCNAVISSTAVAVEVNRWMAFSLSLARWIHIWNDRGGAGAKAGYAHEHYGNSPWRKCCLQLVGLLWCLEVLPDIIALESSVVCELEQTVAKRGLVENQHFCRAP